MRRKLILAGTLTTICATAFGAYWVAHGSPEIDLLAKYAEPHPTLDWVPCGFEQASGQTIAQACYKVDPHNVETAIAFLTATYNHPPLVTHGEGWHSHGTGGFSINPEQLLDFDHLSNPEFLVGSISFTANAHPENWPDDIAWPVDLPENIVVIPLGALPGFVHVELLVI